MGWFSGQSKAAKELERKRQQERDEENAKRADDVCEEQKTPYQKKVDKPPNVLRVTVIRAKELLAVDKKCGPRRRAFKRRRRVDGVERIRTPRAQDVLKRPRVRGPVPADVRRGEE